MLHLPTIFHHLPHLLSKENSLQPAVHVGQGRTGGKWQLVLLLVLFLTLVPVPALSSGPGCGTDTIRTGGRAACIMQAFLVMVTCGVGEPCHACRSSGECCLLLTGPKIFSVLLPGVVCCFPYPECSELHGRASDEGIVCRVLHGDCNPTKETNPIGNKTLVT